MEDKVREVWNGYRIQATYTGSKEANWGDGRGNWNHHRMLVHAPKNGKRIYFDFWASIAEPRVKTGRDVLEAFECFLSDAVSGAEKFDYFCADFGYDEDSIKALNAWKACQRANKKAARIIGSDDYEVLSKLYNDLREILEKEPEKAIA